LSVAHPVPGPTARLTLRELDLDDASSLHGILGDAETMRFYPHPYSLEETRAWIERSERSYRENGFGLWALVTKDRGEFVGDCGLTIQHVEGEPFVEAGWHIKRSHWCRGMATEAGLAVRDHAFTSVGVERLISLVRVENEPSAGVARKLGMTVWKVTEHAGLDHLVFSLTRTDWEALRSIGVGAGGHAS